VSGWADSERRAVVDALRSAGPDAPVVPDGWRTADLAAHLYVREHRPDAALGVVLPGPFAAYTGRVMGSALRVAGYDALLDRIAAGAPWLWRPLDTFVNVVEFFVHTEDVWRADPSRPRRDLPEGLQPVLWSRLRAESRLLLRRVSGVRLRLESSLGGSIETGHGPAVTVRGTPGELMLYAFDRRSVADVELTGDAAAVGRLADTSFGI
jgi:uncharacterized protein (TIGR03085 family)